VRSNESNLLILHPLLKGNHILCHIPDLFNRTATLEVEGVQNVLCLSIYGCFIGDVISNRPHFLPVELLGVQEHPVVEIGFVNVQVHHAGVWTANLRQISIPEATAHLSGFAPVLNFCFGNKIATLHHSSDNSVALSCTFQISNHLADRTAGVQFTQPGSSVSIGVVRSLLLLQVHQNHWHIQIPDSGKHIVRGGISEELNNDQIHISGSEFIAGCG